MIVLGRVVDLDDHVDLGIETMDSHRREVGGGEEPEPVDTGLQRDERRGELTRSGRRRR